MGDSVPQVGMEFETLEATWKYWVNCGKKMGFSKRFLARNLVNVIVIFVCLSWCRERESD